MKTLTVQQKNYLVKRITDITSKKLSTIETEYRDKIKFRTGQKLNLDIEAARAVLDGTIAVKSTEDLMKLLTKRVQQAEDSLAAKEAKRRDPNRYNCYTADPIVSFSTFDFVDRKSVDSFYEVHNAGARKLDAEKKKRRDAVMAESTKVKDKVILEGNDAAVALLEKFEKKVF